MFIRITKPTALPGVRFSRTIEVRSKVRVTPTVECANCRTEQPMAGFERHIRDCRAGYPHTCAAWDGSAFCMSCALPLP